MLLSAPWDKESCGRDRGWKEAKIMKLEEERRVSAQEVGELVREYALLGSREVWKEAMEYMRFLREEVAMVLQESGSGEEQQT